ncbi:hypothetical protein D6817_05510, partial [Candidatus Pacearchaeota archaeon]
VCKAHNVKTSICGQAGSREDMARKLVRLGIDSISVNADVARKISEMVASIEKAGERGVELGQGSSTSAGQQESGAESANQNEESEDIEERVLKELDEDYSPGLPEDKNKDVPPLSSGPV